MKYLKSFVALFESEGDLLREQHRLKPSFTPDEIKQMPEYQDLLAYGDLTDTTSAAIAKSGNIRLQEQSGQGYIIYSNGYIRYQWMSKEVPWYGGAPKRGVPGVYVSPIGDSLNDFLYGQPVRSKEDYIPKFEYLKRIIAKRKGEPIPPPDSERITQFLNKIISDDAGKAKSPIIQKLIKKGIYNPTSVIKSVIKAADYGVF